MKMFMLTLVLSMLKVVTLMLNTWIVIATGNLVLMVMYKLECFSWLIELLGEVR